MTRPIDRPIALSQTARQATLHLASVETSATEDSVSRSSSRISSCRLDQITSQLTELDLAVLYFVSQSRLTTGKQLIRRFWLKDGSDSQARARAGRRALKRLADLRLLDPLPRRVGGVRAGSQGIVYGIGPVGHRLLASSGLTLKRLGTPGDRHVRHTLAITELSVRLYEADQRGELDLIEIHNEPQCWRGFLGAAGARLMLKPDLFVRVGVGALEDRWLIEVDLATESSATVTSKGQRYLAHYRSGTEQRQHGVYPRTLWLVPDERRADQVKAALSRLPVEARRLFDLCRFDEAVPHLAAEARL